VEQEEPTPSAEDEGQPDPDPGEDIDPAEQFNLSDKLAEWRRDGSIPGYIGPRAVRGH
jgi:hypothetical protein